MRKRIILGVAGSAIFLAGILAGMIVSGGIPAFASGNAVNTTPTPAANATGYCTLYEQTLAQQLGVSESKLESANSAALQAVIDQMAKDGKISSQQKSMLEQMLQEYSSQPCSHIQQILQSAKGGHGANGALMQVLAGARASIENAVAPKLGISQQMLDADLVAGQTIAQIAQAHHVALSAVNTAYLNAVQSLLAQAVSKGYITQDQSNMLYSRVTAAVQSGHYPLLDGNFKMGPGGPPQGA